MKLFAAALWFGCFIHPAQAWRQPVTYYLPTGRPTATGEPYTGREQTCAGPRWIPLNTMIHVSVGNRHVSCRMNDYTNRRIHRLDLPPRMFKQLATLAKGKVVADLKIIEVAEFYRRRSGAKTAK